MFYSLGFSWTFVLFGAFPSVMKLVPEINKKSVKGIAPSNDTIDNRIDHKSETWNEEITVFSTGLDRQDMSRGIAPFATRTAAFAGSANNKRKQHNVQETHFLFHSDDTFVRPLCTRLSAATVDRLLKLSIQWQLLTTQITRLEVQLLFEIAKFESNQTKQKNYKQFRKKSWRAMIARSPLSGRYSPGEQLQIPAAPNSTSFSLGSVKQSMNKSSTWSYKRSKKQSPSLYCRCKDKHSEQEHS